MTLRELRDVIDPRDNVARLMPEQSHSGSEDVVVLLSQETGTTLCPVCGTRLPAGEAATSHVNRCLDGGAPPREGCAWLSRLVRSWFCLPPAALCRGLAPRRAARLRCCHRECR